MKAFFTLLSILLLISACQTSRQTSDPSGQSYALDKTTGKFVHTAEFKYVDAKVVSISPQKLIVLDAFQSHERIFTIDSKTEFIEWLPQRHKVSINEIREGDLVRINYPTTGQNNALAIQKNFPIKKP